MGLFTIGAHTRINIEAPKDLMIKLRDNYKIKNFIETGTCHALTAKWAAENFERVFTCENSEKYYAISQKNLEPFNNVDLAFESSQTYIPKIINTEGSNLYWLDSHWTCGESAGEDDKHPLLREIEFINNIEEKKENFIFLDDLRYMLYPRNYGKIYEWPTLWEVMLELNRGKEERFICALQDCLIAVPSHAREFISNYRPDDLMY